MKKLLLLLAVVMVMACTARPYMSAHETYDSRYLVQNKSKTHVRIHRVNQISGSGLPDDCPLVLKVDGIDVVGLQQNQFVDLYLPNGEYSLSVRFKCALTEWKKSVTLVADGVPQVYETETGASGQYRMWRAK
ncbi:hypothetical protein [Pragia fontium]|uniref:hypothetical protein n=1 Tax=Pragia fontium TaxID=82985 RepID=UPI000F6CDB03|nr:hypothetical protein [Pragia fontium]VEJ54649.1 Uncharacterised protein [Pragia fontium]